MNEKDKILEFVDKNTKFLEIGCGNSTLLWVKHCSEVVGVEANEKWYNTVEKMTSGYDNVTLYLEKTTKLSEASYKSAKNYVDRIQKLKDEGKEFDVIYVDGSARVACVRMIAKCFPNALVFVHDYFIPERRGSRYNKIEDILIKQDYWPELWLIMLKGVKDEV